MIQWLQQPKSSIVSTFVECYWLIEKKQGEDSFKFPKLNPDPNAHLIISPIKQTYTYQATGIIENGVGSHLLFPHLQTFQLDHSKPFIHLGIKFKVGALYSIKSLNQVHPTIDSVAAIDLASLIHHEELDISDLLLCAQKDATECCEQLDVLLERWLTPFKLDKHAQLTSRALKVLDTTAISEIGRHLHCTQRTLERAFNKVTGFTLKQCQSMNRLEAMLEYLHSLRKEQIDWLDVVYKFGFSDQPHLIRYLKAQLGLTPNRYANQRGLTIDVYGGISKP